MKCPLCSVEVKAEAMEKHLTSELGYFPLVCLLCQRRFDSEAAADAHFRGPRAKHPGAKPAIGESIDEVMESRLKELLGQARQSELSQAASGSDTSRGAPKADDVSETEESRSRDRSTSEEPETAASQSPCPTSEPMQKRETSDLTVADIDLPAPVEEEDSAESNASLMLPEPVDEEAPVSITQEATTGKDLDKLLQDSRKQLWLRLGTCQQCKKVYTSKNPTDVRLVTKMKHAEKCSESAGPLELFGVVLACLHCDFRIKDFGLSQLKAHIRTAHRLRTKLPCVDFCLASQHGRLKPLQEALAQREGRPPARTRLHWLTASCSLCPRVFKDCVPGRIKQSLRMHAMRAHSGGRHLFVCCQCPCGFQRLAEMLSHLKRRHHPRPLSQLEFRAAAPSTAARVLRLSFGVESSCLECGFVAWGEFSQDALERHCADVHAASSTTSRPCRRCGKRLILGFAKAEASAPRHAFDCWTGRRGPVVCTACPKTFAEPSGKALEHLRRCPRAELRLEATMAEAERYFLLSFGMEYRCMICPYKVQSHSSGNIRWHVKMKHEKKFITRSLEDKLFIVLEISHPKLNRASSDPMGSLDDELTEDDAMLAVEKEPAKGPKFFNQTKPCILCGSYQGRDNFLYHIRLIHLEGSMYFCDACEFASATRLTVVAHTRRFHPDTDAKAQQRKGEQGLETALLERCFGPASERQWARARCQPCDKVLSMLHIKTHIAIHHLRKVIFECRLCPYTSHNSSAQSVNSHVRNRHKAQPGPDTVTSHMNEFDPVLKAMSFELFSAV